MNFGIKLGNYIFDSFGIMNTKVLMRKCGEIGDETAKIILEKSTVESGEFRTVLNKILGKRAEKVILVTDKDTFIAEAQKRCYMTSVQAEELYNGSKSAVLPTLKDGKSLLNLRLNELKNEEVVTLTAHECEHIFRNLFSNNAKIINLLKKIPWFEKKFTKFGEKWGAMISEKSTLAQLLAFAPCEELPGGLVLKSSKELNKLAKESAGEFRDFLYQAEIFERGKNKQNCIIASTLGGIFNDEGAAYAISGEAERAFYKLSGKKTGKDATLSDFRAYMCKLYECACTEEMKISGKKWLKMKFFM